MIYHLSLINMYSCILHQLSLLGGLQGRFHVGCIAVIHFFLGCKPTPVECWRTVWNAGALPSATARECRTAPLPWHCSDDVVAPCSARVIMQTPSILSAGLPWPELRVPCAEAIWGLAGRWGRGLGLEGAD